MLIQVTSPRVLINMVESPEHIRIHTLRRPGISCGEVLFHLTTNFEHGQKTTVPLEPYETFPIEGLEGFEALEYYLPFDIVFGTKELPKYDESHLTDTQLALLGASGFHGIVRSAYRTEGSIYAERIFNFSLNFPVTGGGIVRIANVEHDLVNPTFNPRALTPKRRTTNLDLLSAFNRVHKPISSEAEERRKKRIQDAESSLRALERGFPSPTPSLKVKTPPITVRDLPPLKTDLDGDEDTE